MMRAQFAHLVQNSRCIWRHRVDNGGDDAAAKDADVPGPLPRLTLWLLTRRDTPKPSGRRVVGGSVGRANLGAGNAGDAGLRFGEGLEGKSKAGRHDGLVGMFR